MKRKRELKLSVRLSFFGRLCCCPFNICKCRLDMICLVDMDNTRIVSYKIKGENSTMSVKGGKNNEPSKNWESD